MQCLSLLDSCFNFVFVILNAYCIILTVNLRNFVERAFKKF